MIEEINSWRENAEDGKEPQEKDTDALLTPFQKLSKAIMEEDPANSAKMREVLALIMSKGYTIIIEDPQGRRSVHKRQA